MSTSQDHQECVLSKGSVLSVNGVDLCVQTFGYPTYPPILLIMGATGSMDWWEDEFCERLAAGSRYVIRYDQRDTGKSIHYPPGAPQYTGDDLVADAVGVLDVLGIEKAHLVGMSMGGGIAQLMALEHADRVASLTLISTSPGPGNTDLPPMADELQEVFFGQTVQPNWTDRGAVIDYFVNALRPFASRSLPFDEVGSRELVTRVVGRSINMASSENHYVIDGSDPWRHRLPDVKAPALVVHGTEDPLFRFEHALALAREIPRAHLLPLEQTGHELPRRVWETVVPAILRHTSYR